jgi:hypothetical protein
MKVVLFVDLTAITASNKVPAEKKEPAVTVNEAATKNLFVIAEENGTIAAAQLEMVHPSITKYEDVLFLQRAKLIVIDNTLCDNGTFQQKRIDHKRGEVCSFAIARTSAVVLSCGVRCPIISWSLTSWIRATCSNACKFTTSLNSPYGTDHWC